MYKRQTPACASSIAAFYTATARSVRWFSGLSDPTFWIKDDLSRPDTWTSSALRALREVHQLLLQEYQCVEVDPLAQRPAAAANAPAAPQGAASPLQLPQLNSLAQPASSGPADGTAATSSRLPKQKRITKQIMPRWLPHVQANQAPPTPSANTSGTSTSHRWLRPPPTPRLETRGIPS